jgi:hypothetical protein
MPADGGSIADLPQPMALIVRLEDDISCRNFQSLLDDLHQQSVVFWNL